MNDASNRDDPSRLECRPTKDPAVRWFILAAMLIGFSVWCYLDRKPAPPDDWGLKNINEVSSYLLNNWGPVVLVPISLIAIGMAVRQLSRTLVADAEGIGYGRNRTPWTEIKAIDARQLKRKGMLFLNRSDGGRLKLDSWKLENFRELVAFVEDKLPDAERLAEQ